MSKPRQVVIQQASSNRRQPLLKSHSSASITRVGEVVGGTTAECAAVCCCCPCGLVNLLVLAIYKVPAGLCRRALKNKRREQLMKKGLLPQRRRPCSCGCDETDIQIHPMSADSLSEIKSQKSQEFDKEVMELEKEMWDMFYSTGFWRSPSKREPSQSQKRTTNTNSNLQVTSTLGTKEKRKEDEKL